MERDKVWSKIDLALIFVFIAFELIAGVAVYQRTVTNSARIASLESGAKSCLLESVAWRYEPRPKEEITNTYRPIDESGDTLEFAHKVIANIDMWREATAR